MAAITTSAPVAVDITNEQVASAIQLEATVKRLQKLASIDGDELVRERRR